MEARTGLEPVYEVLQTSASIFQVAVIATVRARAEIIGPHADQSIQPNGPLPCSSRLVKILCLPASGLTWNQQLSGSRSNGLGWFNVHENVHEIASYSRRSLATAMALSRAAHPPPKKTLPHSRHTTRQLVASLIGAAEAICAMGWFLEPAFSGRRCDTLRRWLPPGTSC